MGGSNRWESRFFWRIIRVFSSRLNFRSTSEYSNYFELIRFANSNESIESFLIYLSRNFSFCIFDSSIPFESSSCKNLRKPTSHYWPIIQKNSSLLREETREDEEKTVRLRFVPYSCVTTTSLQHETLLARGGGSRIDARSIVTGSASLHPRSVFLRIYIFAKHRGSPTSLDLSKRASFSFSSFFSFSNFRRFKIGRALFPLFPG